MSSKSNMPIRDRGSKFLHHLSKPMHGYHNMAMDCSSPQGRNLAKIQGLPLPSRPINSYNVFSPRLSPRPFSPVGLTRSPQASGPLFTHNNIGYPYYMPESWFQVEPPMAIEVEEIDGDYGDQIEEVDGDDDKIIRCISELYKRLPSELREQVDWEMIKKRVATTKERGLKHGCTSNSARQDTSHKLERFKTKTIKVGEVVKVESDHK